MLTLPGLLSRRLWGAVVALTALTPSAASQPIELDRTVLTEHIELPRLLDLCAQRLNLNIEYDASSVRGEVTLRLGAGVTDDELWNLTNRLLASHGFTTIEMPGERTLSVVKVSEAAGLARVDAPEQLSDSRAGYVKTLIRLLYAPPEIALEAIPKVLSKPGGSASEVGDAGWILIADLRPHVEQALRVVKLLDVPSRAEVAEVALAHHPATELVALVERIRTTETTVTSRQPTGKLLALDDERRILIVAPVDEVAELRGLIERFDRPDIAETLTYVPRHFGVEEVARLIDQVLQTRFSTGSAKSWRLVTDELTGSLILSATPSQHFQVAQLLERLDRAGSTASRTIRSFQLRNRSVVDVFNLLIGLLEAGALVQGEDGTAAPQEGEDRATESVQRMPPPPVAAAPPPAAPEGTGARSATAQGVSLTIDEGTNTLIAVGSSRTLEQLEALLQTLDVRQPQVLLEVLVVSLSESDMLDLGVELQDLREQDEISAQVASLFGLGSPDPADTSLPDISGTGLTGVLLDQGSFSAVVRALETVNDGRTLTRPKVLVNNNEQATLDSVRQEPFTSTNASDTVATTSFGGTLDAGTNVSVRPQIAEGDHLILDYNVALSTFDGESADPNIPPPRQQNSLHSVVTIPDGFTVVLGGLTIEINNEAESRVPFLGSIPLLGYLFKSRSQTVSRARLYVFIRADILRHERFEFLKYTSRQSLDDLEVEDDWPVVEPRIIR